MVADAARGEDVAKVFERFDAQIGAIDILIANAGIGGQSFGEGAEESWRYLLDANIAGYFACAQHAADRMKEHGGGHIVFIGSVSADNRSAESAPYSATKAAIQAFSEALAKDLAKRNIRVSLIEPGTVGTDMQESDPEQQREEIAAQKMLSAEDLADCIRFVVTRPTRVNLASVRIIPRLQEA